MSLDIIKYLKKEIKELERQLKLASGLDKKMLKNSLKNARAELEKLEK